MTTEAERVAEIMPRIRFACATEVEHVSRCMRITDEYGNLVEDWLVTALVVLREGMRQFPNVSEAWAQPDALQSRRAMTENAPDTRFVAGGAPADAFRPLPVGGRTKHPGRVGAVRGGAEGAHQHGPAVPVLLPEQVRLAGGSQVASVRESR